jgi:predicted nucleic acid-binding protein
MSAFICDCSVTASWCLRDESNAAADRVLAMAVEGEIVVPAIWPAEMANVLWAAERRGRIDAGDAEAALAALRRLRMRIVAPEEGLAGRLLVTARTRELSAYDASYLDLALHEGLPLATLDARMIDAAQAAGVKLLP